MPVHLENESELVHQAQMGSVEAFGVLVTQYERQIYRLSMAITRNAEDAEDVLQETFLKACANIRRFRKESRFYTWLVRIATNEALSKLRRRHGSGYVSLDEGGEQPDSKVAPREVEDLRSNPEESYSNAQLRDLLSKALEELETPLRTVFALRDIEGLSTEETAKVLGLTGGAVKTRLMRARLKLQKKLSPWLVGRSALIA
jgi:RNA polymerase sigma-70 factor (ECF subfamily)